MYFGYFWFLVGKNLAFFFPLIKMQRNKQKIEIRMEFTNIYI